MTAVELEPIARAACADAGIRFVKRVGAGAFKETFHVILQDGTDQAMKLYRPGFSPERTDREFVAMTLCSHPNIAGLNSIATFEHGSGRYLLSLENFFAGGTLTDLVLRSGLLSRQQVLDIGSQLVDAVGHIAARDLVHRDLKPDNIMFRADGTTPVIVDFGLVRDLRNVSLTQTWLMRGPGTPLFAPPEQLGNEKNLIDWRSDQFSLGVLLSYCAFGFHPYEEDGMPTPDIIERVAERKPQTTRFVERAQSAGLPALVEMTKPWPVQRYRTPHDLSANWAAQMEAA